MFDEIVPILILLVVTTGLAVILSGVSLFLGRRTKLGDKNIPYECGIPPKGSTRDPVPVKFYMVAISFILFDLELIFLVPYAMVARELGLFGFVAVLIFATIILVGYFYEIGKGALRWD